MPTWKGTKAQLMTLIKELHKKTKLSDRILTIKFDQRKFISKHDTI